MENQEEREWLTVQQAADLVGVSSRTIWRRIKEGSIKYRELLGSNTRIYRKEFERSLLETPFTVRVQEPEEQSGKCDRPRKLTPGELLRTESSAPMEGEVGQ